MASCVRHTRPTDHYKPNPGSVRFVEWPEDKKRIDIGSFYSDSTKFRKAVGWTPQVDLREGLRRTIAFYREHMDRYVDEAPAEGGP